MSEWRIEYDNDTGPRDESFHEWWTVTDGSRRFQCDTESDANFLFDRLSEWEPIETAPKDGESILAWAHDQHAPRDYYGVAQWAEANPDFPNSIAGWFWPFAIRPTHWMPLPSPPVTD